jgi:hypothetical protein
MCSYMSHKYSFNFNKNFLHDATSHQKNKSNKYVTNIMFSTTVFGCAILNAYTNLRFTIHNKISVNEDYHLLDYETM